MHEKELKPSFLSLFTWKAKNVYWLCHVYIRWTEHVHKLFFR